MVINVSCKFISQKINKIRWRPVATDTAMKPDTFVCGGWQNEPNTSITVWQSSQLSDPTMQANLSRVSDSSTMSDSVQTDQIIDPKLLHEIPHDGDVTDIKYLNKDIFAVASSNGSIALYKHSLYQTPQLQLSWKKSHSFKNDSASCTCIDTYGDNLVSVGEDGRLIQYSIRQQLPIRIIDADSCVNTAVAYLKHNEVVTCNSQGQLSVWDLRKSGEPAKLLLTSDQSALLSLSRHPTLPNVLACGSEDGTLVIWDLKQEKYPETLLSAHKGPIFELKFHPQSPNHLFTCSMDGSIWHWDSSALEQSSLIQHSVALKKSANGDSVPTPWLQWNASKHNLEVCSLIPSSNKPINSLDILQDVLLCGSDNEAFYILTDLPC